MSYLCRDFTIKDWPADQLDFFQSPRYFGADGLRIFNERVFILLPKQCEARNWKLVVTIYIALMVAFSRFFPQLRRYLGMAEKAKKG